MRVSLKKLSFIFSLILALFVIIYKIYLGNITGFDPGEVSIENTPLSDRVFWPDEITYITWFDVRGDAIEKFLNGEREATNFFGYLVGFVYLVFNSWESTLLFGITGLILFYVSTYKLFLSLELNGIKSALVFSFFILSPTVLMLSSGVLRELYIISVVNFLCMTLMKRKYMLSIFLLVLLFFLRNFYLVVLTPLFVYFFFYDSRRRNILVVTSGIFVSFSVFFAVRHFDSIYSTSMQDVYLRIFTSFTGVSSEFLKFGRLFEDGLLMFLERAGLFYQSLLFIYLYVYLLKRKGRVEDFLVVFFFVALLLGVLYGYFLGYFVSRTKLILFWLLCLFFMIELRENRSNACRN